MSDITLDGAAVQFSGTAPASISEVYARLEETLAGQGRVLAGLWIDGQPFDENHGNTPFTTGTRIEARSVALAEALGEISAGLRPELAAAEQRTRALAREAVRVPWPDLHPLCIRHLESTAGLVQRVVEVAALTGEDSVATQAVTALAATLEDWMQRLQAQDAAGLALLLDGAVAPALDRVAGALPGGANA